MIRTKQPSTVMVRTKVSKIPKIWHKWVRSKEEVKKNSDFIIYECAICGVTATKHRLSPTISIDKKYDKYYSCPNQLIIFK